MKLYIAHYAGGVELGSNLDDWTFKQGFKDDFIVLEYFNDLKLFGAPPLEPGEYTVVEFEKPVVVAKVGELLPLHFDFETVKQNLKDSIIDLNIPSRAKLKLARGCSILWQKQRYDGLTTVCLDSGERVQFNKQGELI